MALVLLCAGVRAFPLTGGNGIVNATVYGVTAESDESNTQFRIDMSAIRMSPNNNYLVELVDSEDRVHGTSEEGNNFGGGYLVAGEQVLRNNGSVRGTLVFTVPRDVIIKRLKITPDNSDPFSIDWNGVPRTSSDGITMGFYSGQRRSPESVLENEYEYQWIFDIKVTNTENTTLSFSTGDFALRDNNHWVYTAEKGSSREIKLLPNESLRFPITFIGVGEFARPSEILFNNVTMDIGAWV